jgi:hypothetical protein
MQLNVFVLPVKNPPAAEAEMNALLRGHRVLAVKKELLHDPRSQGANELRRPLPGMGDASRADEPLRAGLGACRHL